jgi:hypothetical protein
VQKVLVPHWFRHALAEQMKRVRNDSFVTSALTWNVDFVGILTMAYTIRDKKYRKYMRHTRLTVMLLVSC